MENLIFIQAVPHDLYFQWQIEVQIVNFRKFGVSDKMEICVWHPKGMPNLKAWETIQDKYPEVNISSYEDGGVNLGLYIPQLRPHSIKKHFAANAERLKDKVFFYHDSDIIFNYLPDFEKLCADDICWESDTSSYLDYNYLKRKEVQGNIPEHEAIGKLAEIGKIDIETIKSYSNKTGGAQTILKGIDSEFWEDVERMCIEIRENFFYGVHNSINRKYFKDENHGFQSWCADMWALNFALWNRGIKSDVTKELDFSWATDNMETFKKKPIFHNAGATGQPGIFYKGAYIASSPLHQNLELPSEDKASRMYVLAINEVK
jgi:hypothetical protein